MIKKGDIFMREYKDKATYIGKEISIHLRESLNQEGKFSTHHMRFDGKLSCGGKDYYFPYQCNPAYTTPTVEDIMEALLSDISSYECSRDIDDFYKEFGFEKVSDAIKAYESCKETSEALHRMFSEQELNELYELSSNGWEEEREDR